MPVLDHVEIYEVFARRRREEPLRHVGTVTAPNVEMARLYARVIYDEDMWDAMVVVPRAAIIPVEPRYGGSSWRSGRE
ncbi:MAG: phenylacetic acid degradation b [Acidobacteria bacterium]|nr:phenylacetic acid degradation b [Acidobacteriota bacterium]